MPRLPPAPGLFSTVTGWPRIFCISLAVARVAMSTAPAGVNGTTMRIAFVGKACAKTVSGNSRAIANRRSTGGPLRGRVARNYALGRGREYRGPATDGETPPAAGDLRLLRRRRRGRGDAARQLQRLPAGAAAASGPGECRLGGHEGRDFRQAREH